MAVMLVIMRWHNERIILLDPDILLETHLPQEINARVDHIKEIEDCLRRITESRKPVNCWLHGGPGAGRACGGISDIGALSPQETAL